ncbi:DnaJ domain-containing protein [Temperatibacter marinus]|uniref:DnaJ domain-containing protein n=1 Tax=Temperatibacter marinus TaxID=1456591 RepID=A0AA52EF81_9PROT|nr:DnaJ domain-containing protein [Temperatibacter marinus]WND02563.1 DnaJ domain-containing protein [Temperatibacter marinus]
MIWLVAGLVFALVIYVILQWLARAETTSITKGMKSLGLTVLILLSGLSLLAVLTGRAGFIPVFLFLGGMAVKLSRLPTVLGATGFSSQHKRGSMSRKEALEVLGLDETATEKDIKAAYKKLISQNHPDKGGSDWLAAKLNEAKKILIDE